MPPFPQPAKQWQVDPIDKEMPKAHWGQTGCQWESEGANLMALESAKFSHGRVNIALCYIAKDNFRYFDLCTYFYLMNNSVE